MRKLIFFLVVLFVKTSFAQTLGPLTVEKIMRDPKWIGTSPSNPYWNMDSRYLFFSWNPEKAVSDSIYYITLTDLTPKKTTWQFRNEVLTPYNISYNSSHTAYVYAKDGDIFYVDVKSNSPRRITETVDVESNPQFISNDTKIAYLRNQNLFSFDLANGLTTQLTNFQRGTTTTSVAQTNPFQQRGGQRGQGQQRTQQFTEMNSGDAQEKWLEQNQLETSEILRERKEKREMANAYNRSIPKPKQLRAINIEDKNISGIIISPDGKFVTYRLSRPANAKQTIVPNYVTESGFTTDIPGRTKVGEPQTATEFYVYDVEKDSAFLVRTNQIPGITDLPDYVKDYPTKDSSSRRPRPRAVNINGPFWNEKGTHAVVEIRSQDNKDRWLMLLDPSKGKLSLLDRQRDEAWIGGPGIGFLSPRNNFWIDDNNFWYQSEATGYSHLYKVNVVSGEKTALTSGKFEVQQVNLSKDKKYFYITTNEVHPGEKQFYRLSVNGGKPERITTMTGANQVTISPDEKTIAILYSYANKPWELYIQENRPGGKIKQVTNKAMSDEFKSYAWRDPEIITLPARDGQLIYARLFRPTGNASTHPAVLFVHGAGYLQNAHRWWSDSYFREYMFNNLLADNGYVVMDIDYRGSAGYGRDWRTGIYRHMGGKDLDDEVDAAKYMVEKLNVDSKRIGMYGGSYGGFMTLMAMFTQPDVFAAGAGLRCVTDWAHYNHGYTSNILNEPFNDSLAYKRSSPIYFAEGLKGHLLMCHGMVDQNVHFQDIVRLTQRLIELHKDNWELAVYPMEDHGFVEPSSWTDEYKRVFKLFETTLK